MMTLSVDCVWDIETANWDTYVVGALWTPTDGVRICRSEDDLAESLLALPSGAVAWAHAGGRFDVLWLLDWCRRNARVPRAQIRLSGSTIASLKISGGPILRDSCRLIPMSLREACTMFPGCAQKERLSFSYEDIAPDMPREKRAELEAYLIADVESLRDTLHALRDYAEASGIDCGGTVASSAWKTAKATCGLDDTAWDLRAYKTARAGYYGGLCAVGRTEAPKVHRYDRASAYPAALREAVPCGDLRVLVERTAPLAWKRDRPGIYQAVVDMPDQLAPPLPIRHGARLVYPHGRLVGAWPRDELRHAVECGGKIVRLTGGVAWADEKPLLAPHVEKCFALRAAAPTRALKVWLKFIANSLTGAFAQAPEQDIVALGDYADDARYEQVGRYDWIWRRSVFHVSSRAHVQWAATLTARARVELHRQIDHAGDDWCYSDTDSVIATRELTRNVGDDLGQWVAEGEADNFHAIAPKVYTYDESVPGGIGPRKRYARAKGIPDAVPRWDRIAAGAVVKLDRGVRSLLVAARGDKLFDRTNSKRQIHPRPGWIGARIIDGTRTRAPSVGELADMPV
jgi:hypothetical protein